MDGTFWRELKGCSWFRQSAHRRNRGLLPSLLYSAFRERKVETDSRLSLEFMRSSRFKLPRESSVAKKRVSAKSNEDENRTSWFRQSAFRLKESIEFQGAQEHSNARKNIKVRIRQWAHHLKCDGLPPNHLGNYLDDCISDDDCSIQESIDEWGEMNIHREQTCQNFPATIRDRENQEKSTCLLIFRRNAWTREKHGAWLGVANDRFRR